VKVWIGIAMFAAVAFGAVEPNFTYWRVNNNYVVKIVNPGPLPYYCIIAYDDDTADREILLPQDSMTSDKWRVVDMEATRCIGDSG
jgi:hypothetical protein